MANFSEYTLVRDDGEAIGLVTHMEIGPDGLLYASTFDGRIQALDVQAVSPTTYVATLVHEIDALLSVQNHNDDGTPVTIAARAVMGFDVVGTAENPVIYVTSNDPRIDAVADTNSGTLHQLTMDGSGNWQRVDLVRGIPRSQHDHLTNGVEHVIDENGNARLMISVGGTTNAGAPSQPLKYVPEYALSGAVLEVDLAAITAMTLKTDSYGASYYYNLPTLDDPTRAGVNEGVDESIEFYGGNGGLNQAKLINGGPVTLYATGIRNATEILETENGDLLLFDNGGNPSWGGAPVIVDGIATNLPTDGSTVTTNQDQLHLILEGAYLGHPNPTRASGSASGIYEQDNTGTPVAQLPSDYDEVVYQTDPQQGFFLSEGTQDGAIALSSKSTNGFAEYTYADAYEGELVGNIFAVRYGTGSMIRLQMTDANGDGTPESGTLVEEYFLGAGQPIDVLAPKLGEPLHGLLLYSSLVENGSIRIMVPDDGSTVQPTEDDRDGDGLTDIVDPFAYDVNNGKNTIVGDGQIAFWDFESTSPASTLPGGISGFAIGITGFMINGVDDPETLSISRFDPVIQGGDDVVLGGTANTVLIGSVPGGVAKGSQNDLYHGFQAGFTPLGTTFHVTAEMLNQFAFIDPAERSDEQLLGAYVGDGTQSNFVSISIGNGFMEIHYEEDDVEVVSQRIFDPSLLNVDENFLVTEVDFAIDRVSGQLVGTFSADTLDGEITGEFDPITLSGNVLDAVQGNRSINGVPSAAAWGLMASSGSATPFQGNFTEVSVTGGTLPPDPEDVVAAINVGGEQYASSAENILFSPDPGISAGTGTLRDKAGTQVFGTQDDRLYQTYRFGEFSYDIDVSAPGTYRVDFYLTEPFHNAAGNRQFDIALEGGVPGQLNDVDLYALSGGLWQSRILTHEVEVTDGTLNIDLTASVDWAVLNGFIVSTIAESGLEPVTAEKDFASLDEDTSILIDVLNNDSANAILQSVGNASHGSVAIESGEVRYTPNADFFGSDTFVYTVTNGDGATDVASVSLTVDPVNDAPTDLEISETLVSDEADPGDVVALVSAKDVDGDDLVYTVNDPRFEVNNADQLFLAAGTDLSTLGGTSIPIEITADDLNGGVTTETFSLTITDTTDLEIWLVDATTDTRVGPIEDGAVIETSVLSLGQYAIEAVVAPELGAESVFMDFGSAARTENVEPYALFGDANGDYFGQSVPNGPQTIAVSAYSGNNLSGSLVAETSIDFEFDAGAPGSLEAHFNIANEQITASDGAVFMVGPGPSIGSIKTRNRTLEIAETEDDQLYDSYGFGQDFVFSIDVPREGSYQVDFLLAEIFHNSPGSRIFDIQLEGQPYLTLDNIDIVDIAGGAFEAITLTETVDVTDGTLDIRFIAETDSALINAMSIYEVPEIA